MEEFDRLSQMWVQQKQFMQLLQQKRGFPKFPIDLTTKDGQHFCKTIAYEAMGELFESIQELKNSKGHRATEIAELDRSKLVEELVDSLHYYVELCLLMGVSSDELFSAYIKKGEVNTSRIENGY